MKLTLPVIALLLFSSCTPYQYLTVSSEQLSQNEKNDFVFETDTVKLAYHFTGYRGPVQITIFNKTNEPLEINWKKSALISNDQASAYYSPNLLLNGSIRQDSSAYLFSGSYPIAGIKADIYVNEPSQFIPPQSSISKTLLALPLKDLIDLSSQKKELYRTADHAIKYRKAKYSKENAPFSFRSYLNFNYGGNQGKEFSIEHYFYVSEVWESEGDPSYFPPELKEKGNIFYQNP